MSGKIFNFVLFCNDINLKTLINVKVYDDFHLIITCKSFVKRFNIEDRKQVNSWITKSWHPFTCGAVKDPLSDTLYSVINYVNLCKWTLFDQEIEVSKKFLFTSIIYSLVSAAKSVYIVYSSGFVEKLENGLKSQKDAKPKIIGEEDEILNVQIFKKESLAALLVKEKNNGIVLYKVHIGSVKDIQRSLVNLEGHSLTGSTILSFGYLVTSWSNGFLYSYNIMDGKPTQQLPGLAKGQINILNSKKRIKILELSSNYLALHGMNINEEGGLLVLWDYKFGVPVNSKPLKMYRNPPLAWGVQGGAVVADGGSLLYAATDLAPSSVASMVGSRIGDRSLNQEDSVIGIGVGSDLSLSEVPLAATKTILSNKSIGLADAIQSINYDGASEDVLLKILIPQLITDKNAKLLRECLSAFRFVPENCIVEILQFFLHLPDDVVPSEDCVVPLSKPSSKGKRKRMNLEGADKQPEGDTECPFSLYKSTLINEVLCVPCTESELSLHIRSLDFKTSLILLKYLHYLLGSGKALSEGRNSKEIPSIETTSLWMSFLLDANYHQMVMTSEVDIQRELLSCFNDIITLYNITEASHSIEILIERVLASKPLPLSQNDLPYSIENLIL